MRQKLLHFFRKLGLLGADMLVLRLGLGLSLLYAGFDILRSPDTWIGYVPQWVEMLGASREHFLAVHGIGEIVLGVALISSFWLPVASLLVALDFLSILVFYGIDSVSFRDFGLMMAAFALFLRSLERKAE